MGKKEYVTPAISVMIIEMAELMAASTRGSVHVYVDEDDAWEDEI